MRGWPFAAYWLLGLVLAAYFVSLVARGGDQNWPAVDNYGVAAFELAASVLCLARGLGRRSARTVPLVLGAALLSWSVGDLLLAAESVGGAKPPVPSWADLFYLGFYPLTYLALTLLLRSQLKRFSAATWLDGAVAGLGAAAVCAAFAFAAVLRSTGGGAAAVATNLAYPIGDALLLALIVAGSATLPGRRRASWVLLAAGCALNVIGDTFNLFQASGHTVAVGNVVNGVAWPAAILVMSLAVWVHPSDRGGDRVETAPGFALPALAALAALTILCYGSFSPVSRVALGLAAATLMAAGGRSIVSLRSLRLLTEERRRQAVTDALTGLGNRRQLNDFLEGALATGGTLAFLFIDLNRFKEINDAFGHPAGDQLLRQLGPRLQTALEDGDLLVRIGGDELAAVLPGADGDRAAAVAARLTACFDEPFALDGVSVRVGASIGIALSPLHAGDGAGLVRCADAAMYRAKLTAVPSAIYEPDVDDTGDRLLLVEELHEALAEDRFVLHYQPQVELSTSETLGVEALIRWFHPRLGSVSPLDFLPLAEQAGLMRALTTTVLEKAITQCATWRAQGHPITMSVNISVSNLLDEGFTDIVRQLLRHHRLAPQALTLEITETTIISDFERSKAVIDELHAIGVGVSIDDFGAGFTSLAYLSGLAIDELKLDRTFITPLASAGSERALPLLRATIALGHAMGMCVVAEGVEDLPTLELLGRLGCDRVQGYVISRPVPSGQVALGSPRSAVTTTAAPA